MSPELEKRGRLLPHLLLLGVVLVWGTTFPLVKAALRDVSPLLFNLLRMALAALLLLALNARTLRRLSRRQLWLSVLVGVFLALGYQLQTLGLARTTPTRSAFLTGLVVVLVPLFSAVPGVAPRGAQRPGLVAYVCALIAFAGVVLLTGPSTTSAAGPSAPVVHGFGLGEWLTVGCACAFAAHLLMTARAAATLPARALGTLQIAFAAIVMLLTLPFERVAGSMHFHLTGIVIVALAVTSIFATAAAFTIQSWAQERLPASHVALVFTLEPVFAWLTSLLFFDERLGPRSLLGAGLILTGILVVELWPTRRSAVPVSIEGSTL